MLLARQRKESPGVVPDFTSPISIGAHVEESSCFLSFRTRLAGTHRNQAVNQSKATQTVQSCTTTPNCCAGADSWTQNHTPLQPKLLLKANILY